MPNEDALKLTMKLVFILEDLGQSIVFPQEFALFVEQLILNSD